MSLSRPRTVGSATAADTSGEKEFAYVGRQPIFDRDLEVNGYELLFRRGDTLYADVNDPDEATAEVFCATFMDIGLDVVVSDRRAFINLSRSFLLGPYPELFPANRVVLEILEDVVPDEEVLARVAHLRRAGYKIALDDFVFSPQLKPLAEMADIIKIDVLAMSTEELAEHIKHLEGTRAQLLAEKVETAEQYSFCRDLGFSLFQGYFLSRPQVLTGGRMPPERMAALELLARVNKPDVTIPELESIVSRDVSLSFKLLRYMNSAWLARPVEIESIHHALGLLGVERVRVWVSVLILARFKNKPNELMVTAMVRGRMCQDLAGRSGVADTHGAFTVGLFSILDALVDEPLEQVIRSLGLADTLRDALVERVGPLGHILGVVLSYELADWKGVSKNTEFTKEQVRSAWVAALEWVAVARSVLVQSRG